MTTNSANNVYLADGQLYLMPTLTSDSISGGYGAVMNGATYKLDGCTASSGTLVGVGVAVTCSRRRRRRAGGPDIGAWVQGGPSLADFILKRQSPPADSGNGTATANGNGTTVNGTTTGNGTFSGNSTSGNSTASNSTASNSTASSGPVENPCTAVSSAAAGSVINPVMSGRINTRGKKTIRYGKVEVRAKLPQGDWLWPAIWMLPEGNGTTTGNGTTAQGTGVYGAWPVSGEIDVGPVWQSQRSD